MLRRRRKPPGYWGYPIARGFVLGPLTTRETESLMMFLNHSCEPNVGIRGQRYVPVAMRAYPRGRGAHHRLRDVRRRSQADALQMQRRQLPRRGDRGRLAAQGLTAEVPRVLRRRSQLERRLQQRQTVGRHRVARRHRPLGTALVDHHVDEADAHPDQHAARCPVGDVVRVVLVVEVKKSRRRSARPRPRPSARSRRSSPCSCAAGPRSPRSCASAIGG